jgi:stage V sporulation protein SpoVS
MLSTKVVVPAAAGYAVAAVSAACAAIAITAIAIARLFATDSSSHLA